jgi:hypothetical protein
MAILSASVPPEVNTISLVSAFMKFAIFLLLISIAFFVFLPKEWVLDGFPK